MRSFTLIELIIVIIIIGILSTLAVTQYGGAKEKALDKEAIANLKLIQSAEKIYRMETGAYFQSVWSPGFSNQDLNNNLKLSLTSGSNRNWDFYTWTSGCARATRNGNDGRSWYLVVTSELDPVVGAGCP